MPTTTAFDFRHQHCALSAWCIACSRRGTTLCGVHSVALDVRVVSVLTRASAVLVDASVRFLHDVGSRAVYGWPRSALESRARVGRRAEFVREAPGGGRKCVLRKLGRSAKCATPPTKRSRRFVDLAFQK
mmetsp:Transcript_752/g.2010  ORF Transcript_752/g.2010 Transcript_752/m.2010 type:complete len:130 (-) Transcript_752:1186-1575(-)